MPTASPPIREVGVRPAQSLGDSTRDPLDLRTQLLVDCDANTGSTREQLDRAVVVRRPQPARDDQQVVAQSLAQRGLELRRLVPDDRDPRRLDAQPHQRRGQERPVAVVAVAADELGARRDDRGSYAGRQPLAVTTITRGFCPGTIRVCPLTMNRRFSGVSICTQSFDPRIATGPSPFCTVPS
jgi:hypothetical protein